MLRFPGNFYSQNHGYTKAYWLTFTLCPRAFYLWCFPCELSTQHEDVTVAMCIIFRANDVEIEKSYTLALLETLQCLKLLCSLAVFFMKGLKISLILHPMPLQLTLQNQKWPFLYSFCKGFCTKETQYFLLTCVEKLINLCFLLG